MEYATNSLISILCDHPTATMASITVATCAAGYWLHKSQCRTQLNNALLQAAKQGSYSKNNKLLEQGADVLCEDDSHATPLHYASEHGHRDLFYLFISQGAEVILKSDFIHRCEGPIQRAIRTKQIPAIRSLLRFGADIENSANGTSPWQAAIESEDVKIMECFIHNAQFNPREDSCLLQNNDWVPADEAEALGLAQKYPFERIKEYCNKLQAHAAQMDFFKKMIVAITNYRMAQIEEKMLPALTDYQQRKAKQCLAQQPEECSAMEASSCIPALLTKENIKAHRKKIEGGVLGAWFNVW